MSLVGKFGQTRPSVFFFRPFQIPSNEEESLILAVNEDSLFTIPEHHLRGHLDFYNVYKIGALRQKDQTIIHSVIKIFMIFLEINYLMFSYGIVKEGWRFL